MGLTRRKFMQALAAGVATTAVVTRLAIASIKPVKLLIPDRIAFADTFGFSEQQRKIAELTARLTTEGFDVRLVEPGETGKPA